MKKFILQKISAKSPSSSSPNSAEINEEKQEDDDFQFQLPIPQNPAQQIQNPQNPLQEVSNPQTPLQEITRPQNPLQETTNPDKRKRPQMEDQFYEQRKRPPRKEDKLEEMSKPPGISLDSVPTFKPRISGMELAEDCILFPLTSETEEEDDYKTMHFVREFLRRGKPVPQSWKDYQALSGFLVECGESVSLEILVKKLAKLKSKFFLVMERIGLYPGSILTGYDSSLQRFGNEVWGDEWRLSIEEADREISEMYPHGFDDSGDGEIEKENAELDAMYEANKAQKEDEDCILFVGSTCEEDDDVKTMKYVVDHLDRGNPFPQCKEDYDYFGDVIGNLGEYFIPNVLEKKLTKLKNKFFMLMDRIRPYPGIFLSDYDDHLQKFGEKIWSSSEEEAVDLAAPQFLIEHGLDEETLEHHNAELDAMYATNKEKAKKEDEEVKCMLFEGSKSEEDDDVKTMKYIRDHVEGGNPFPQCVDDYQFLLGIISSFGECIFPKVLEKKLANLKIKFFVLEDRIRLYPGMTLSDYNDHLRKFGNDYWRSEEEEIARFLGYASSSMDEETLKQHNAELDAMYATNKAKLLPMIPQKEANLSTMLETWHEDDGSWINPDAAPECILLKRSTSEKDDDISTMKYFEAYENTSLEISTSTANLVSLYNYFRIYREDIKLELLKQKVTNLRKKYSVLRNRGRKSDYEVEMYQLGKKVWGSRMLEESPSSVGVRKRLQFGENRGNQSGFGKLSQKKRLENLTQDVQEWRQTEVKVALRQLYGKKGDEWTKEYKKKVKAILMDDELAKPDKKDQGLNEELCREKSATWFADDWEVAEDCIFFKRSKSEKEDDNMTLKCLIAYIHQNTGQVDDDFEFVYGVVSSCGECAGLEVLKKKLAKLLSKYLMLIERIRLYSGIYWTEYDDILHRFGAGVWGSSMLQGTLPLLDSTEIGIPDQENATIAEMRASAGRRQGRRFRISQDPTIGIGITDQKNDTITEMRASARSRQGRRFIISKDPTTGRSRIMPASISTSVDEAFDSRPAISPNRGLEIREAGKQTDDRPPEAVPDVKNKGKQQPKEEAPTEKPTKSQCIEKLLLLFREAETEEEDDLILLRYASAYGRNVTSPTAAGLYQFILANLPTGDGISWFLLKLKLTMLESRYLTILGVLDSNGNMEDYLTVYHTGYLSELYRLGRQFWGDEIADQNPDGHMGSRGAS